MKKALLIFLFCLPLMASGPLLKKRTYTGVNYGELTSFVDCTLFADKMVKFIEAGTVNSQQVTPITLSPNVLQYISKAAQGEVIPVEGDGSFSIYKAFDSELREIRLKGRGVFDYINSALESAILIHLLDLNC